MTRTFALVLLAGSSLMLEAAAPPAPTPAVAQPASLSVLIKPSGRRARVVRRHHYRSTEVDTRIRSANSAATQEPAAQGFLNAVQVYPFADGAIFHAYTAPGRVTDIALQPGEALGSVAAGDTVRWVIGDTSSGLGDAKRTHVLVKPFMAGLSTNLVITTDRRIYYVALTSSAGSAMAALSWTYPADQLIALQKAADKAGAAAPIASGLDMSQLHSGYAISGDQPSWRPLRAFDDGRQTFIEFPADIATGEAPPLFLVDGKGSAQLVNYRVKGRFYVIDRLFDTAELRLGLKHQAVVRISRIADGTMKRRAS
jgi:P-type conjugative transfer protein TrbG